MEKYSLVRVSWQIWAAGAHPWTTLVKQYVPRMGIDMQKYGHIVISIGMLK